MPFADALKRPFSVRTLPGLIFVLIPIVGLFAAGYKAACAVSAMERKYELPRWQGWKKLFLFGLGIRIIQIVWLAPAALAYFGLWLKLKAINAMLTSGSMNLLSELLGIKKWLWALLVLFLLAAFFMPAASLNFLSEGKFRKAFSATLFKRALSKEYLAGWLIAAAYALVVFGAIFVAIYWTVSSFSTNLALPIVLALELIALWFPGITIWTILGESWGKLLYRELSQQRLA